MKTKTYLTIAILLLLAALTACSGLGQQAEPTTAPLPLEDVPPIISATGEVMPARWSRLSLAATGTIAELAIQVDDRVAANQTLIQLDGEKDLQAAISAAELEVASAQRALDDLYRDPELRIANANQELVAAKQAVKDAQQYLDNLQSAAKQVDVEQAKANLALAKKKLDDAIDDYEPYANKSETNLMRATLLSKKAQAQKDYEVLERYYNNLIGTSSELDIAEAEAQLQSAQARQVVAERNLEIYTQGPDPRDVSLAETRLQNAKTQLEAANDALENRRLLAPFDGTVSELYLRPNEWVSPGQPALLLADLDHLRVETTDLNEIDVARLQVGDTASITFDALPDTVVTGTVVQIASKSDESSGVNYRVVLELASLPDALRWGMTAFVDIQVE
jgi:multidrug efflux pump subunit AcrA (membrane-fusion protein)